MTTENQKDPPTPSSSSKNSESTVSAVKEQQTSEIKQEIEGKPDEQTRSNDQQQQQQQQLREEPPADEAARSLTGSHAQETQTRATEQRRSNDRPRSIKSEIVVRQKSEETLHTMQLNLRFASHQLLQLLGNYLARVETGTSRQSQHPSTSGGISLPASAVAWLAHTLLVETEQSTATTLANRDMLSKVRRLLPYLTHLRITVEPWPSTAPPTATAFKETTNAASNLQQQYQSMQFLHRLRYSPQVNVSIFPKCQVLFLDQVPPDWIRGMPSLRNTLQVLRVERAYLYDLEGFFLDSNKQQRGTKKLVYKTLTHLKLSQCSLGEMTRGLAPVGDDEQEAGIGKRQRLPLSRMPNLVSLSLSRNDIRSEATALGCGISNCTKLATLDLSYNRLTSLPNAALHLGNIQTLVLTGNQIESANGLDRLYALQSLALDDNNIQEWSIVAGLARIPELKALRLKGNPLMGSSLDRKYSRVMLLDLFREQRWGALGESATFRQLSEALPVLDDKPASERELKALQQRAFPTVSAIILPRNYNDDDGEIADTLPAGATVKNLQVRASANGGDHHSSEENITTLAWTERKAKKRRKGKAVKAIIIDEDDAQNSSVAKVKRSLNHVSDEESEGAVSSEERKVSETKIQASPKVCFSVKEVLSSLSPPTTANTTPEFLPHTNQDKGASEEAEQIERTSNVADAGDLKQTGGPEKAMGPITDFDWPQPIAYLPEQNLYDEFELKPQVKKSSKKQKRRKDKNGKTRKARQESPATATPNNGGFRDTSFDQAATTRKVEKAKQSGDVVVERPPSTTRAKPSPVQELHKASINEEISSPESTSNASALLHNEHASSQKTTTKEAASVASAASGRGETKPTNCDLRSVSSDGGDAASFVSPRDSVAGAFFPAMAMAVGGLDDTTCSSMGTNRSAASGGRGSKASASKIDNFLVAEMKSKFLGLEQQRQLKVSDHLELYFKTFVFPDRLPGMDTSQDSSDEDSWHAIFFRFPRVQLFPRDRELRETNRKKTASMGIQRRHTLGEEEREQLVRVWKENVLACGKPSLRRLSPNRSAHYGFHGELTWVDGKVKTVSDCRQVILCLSTTSFYVILDNDALTAKLKNASVEGNTSQAVSPDSTESKRSARKKARVFPSPITEGATFEQALWPHAIACHSLEDLTSITIGFGFQRMTLRFRNTAYPSAVDFTYLLLTSNKIQTVSLLQEIQGLVKEMKVESGQADLTEDPIKIDNDDKFFLDALAVAITPDPLGAIIHYQIVKQRWKHGQRGAVSRACVVTDTKVFLLDEDYTGDGSKSTEAESNRRLGSPHFSLVDGADLQQVAEVRAADADPNAITIVIRPLSSLQRTHRWRLLCRDGTGAEKLVEDVRKGMSLLE